MRPLIEIDYLHETALIVEGIPVYPVDAAAYPYTMVVSDPRPAWDAGKVAVYGVGVDMALPAVPIPLLNDEQLVFDFDAVYQYTFMARRFHNLIDYSREPVRFGSYRREDQGVFGSGWRRLGKDETPEATAFQVQATVNPS